MWIAGAAKACACGIIVRSSGNKSNKEHALCAMMTSHYTGGEREQVVDEPTRQGCRWDSSACIAKADLTVRRSSPRVPSLGLGLWGGRTDHTTHSLSLSLGGPTPAISRGRQSRRQEKERGPRVRGREKIWGKKTTLLHAEESFALCLYFKRPWPPIALVTYGMRLIISCFSFQRQTVGSPSTYDCSRRPPTSLEFQHTWSKNSKLIC